jgi:hypothetical protein
MKIAIVGLAGSFMGSSCSKSTNDGTDSSNSLLADINDLLASIEEQLNNQGQRLDGLESRPTPGVPTPELPGNLGLKGLVPIKVCSQNAFEIKDETALSGRRFKVEVLDERGDIEERYTLGTGESPATDENGCAIINVYDDTFQKVTLSNTLSGEPDIVRYISTIDGNNPTTITGGVTPTDSDALWFTPRINEVTKVLERYIRLSAYADISAWKQADLDALYKAMNDCSDFTGDHDDGLLLDKGSFTFDKCDLANNALLQKFAKAPRCVAAPTFESREFDEGGTIADVANTDIGDGANLFEVGDPIPDCLLTTYNGATVAVSYTVGGVTITGASDTTDLCVGYNSDDDRLAGIFGQVNAITADKNAFSGFIRLAAGKDRDEASHADLPGGIFFFGAESIDDNDDDVKFASGDKLVVDFGTTLNAYNVCNTDNAPDNELDAAGYVVDDDSSWMVLSQVSCNADSQATGDLDSDDYFAAVENTTNKVLLVQNCYNRRDVDLSLTGDTVSLALNDDFTITQEDAGDKRLFAFLATLVIDSADTVAYANIARYIGDQLDKIGEISEFCRNKKDALSGGTVVLSPIELAQVAARCHALCDPEVVELNGGNDFVIGTSSSEDDPTKTIPLWHPNIAVAGFPARSEIAVSGALVSDKATTVDDYGMAFIIAPEAKAGDEITISAGGVTQTCTVE